MKSSIKIIKKPKADPIDLETPAVEKSGKESVEQSTREMVTTVKSWIAELQQRKRGQLSHLPVIPTAPVSQNP